MAFEAGQRRRIERAQQSLRHETPSQVADVVLRQAREVSLVLLQHCAAVCEGVTHRERRERHGLGRADAPALVEVTRKLALAARVYEGAIQIEDGEGHQRGSAMIRCSATNSMITG